MDLLAGLAGIVPAGHAGDQPGRGVAPQLEARLALQAVGERRRVQVVDQAQPGHGRRDGDPARRGDGAGAGIQQGRQGATTP